MKSMTDMIWGVTIVLALSAGWIDWRSRRLPNWLTVTGFAAGIIGNSIFFGWAGMKDAFIGAAIPLGVLLPVVLLRGLGAGDWKLMGALGALVGREEILHLLLATIIFAGVIAVGQMIWHKRVFVTLRNMWELVQGFFIFGLKPHPELNIYNGEAKSLPFGVAAAAATLVCWGIVVAGI